MQTKTSVVSAAAVGESSATSGTEISGNLDSAWDDQDSPR